MKILVANLGSTSFKYRLFDMADERVLARGGVERIGSAQSRCFVESGGAREEDDGRGAATTPRRCGSACNSWPTRRGAASKDPSELAAIGFKAVHARGVTGVQRVDDKVLSAMEAYADVAPAHNPPYVAAMRLLSRELPEIPLVAAFETGFHETHRPGGAAVRGAAGVGDEARRPALGLSRRQPPLHRRAHGPAARASPTRRSFRATWAAAVLCAPLKRAYRSPTASA